MIVSPSIISTLSALKVSDPSLYTFVMGHISPRKETSFMKGIDFPADEDKIIFLKRHIKLKTRFRGPRKTHFAGHCTRADAVSASLYVRD